MPRQKRLDNLSPEDQERFHKAVADYEGVGRHEQLNQDPRYSYFLAAKDEIYPTHPQNVSAMKEIGYEVVNPEANSGEVMPLGTVKSADEGAIQTPEMVLMRIPRELREARDAKVRELGETRIRESEEELVEAMDRAGAVRNNGRKIFVFSGPGRTSVSS